MSDALSKHWVMYCCRNYFRIENHPQLLWVHSVNAGLAVLRHTLTDWKKELQDGHSGLMLWIVVALKSFVLFIVALYVAHRFMKYLPAEISKKILDYLQWKSHSVNSQTITHPNRAAATCEKKTLRVSICLTRLFSRPSLLNSLRTL